MLAAKLLIHLEKAGVSEPGVRTPYRTAEPTEITIGKVPRAKDAWVIAHVGGGEAGVAAALIGAAAAAGWIGPLDEANEEVEAPPDTVLASLHRALGGRRRPYAEVKRCCASVARSLASSLVRSAAPLARTEEARRRAYRLTVAAGVAVSIVGAVRVARASTLHRPFGFLLLLMLLTVFLTFRLATRAAAAPGPRATRYLTWARGAMQSLQRDVASGRDASVGAVSLAVALYGLHALVSAPPLRAAGVTAGVLAAHATCGNGSGGSGTSCGSSSCGSSSCGGGGGGCGG